MVECFRALELHGRVDLATSKLWSLSMILDVFDRRDVPEEAASGIVRWPGHPPMQLQLHFDGARAGVPSQKCPDVPPAAVCAAAVSNQVYPGRHSRECVACPDMRARVCVCARLLCSDDPQARVAQSSA